MAFAESKNGLEKYFGLIEAIQYADYFDVKKSSYLVSNIKAMNTMM